MVSNKNIDRVIKILEDQVRKFGFPVVENISQKYKSPFHILVSTILSARTKDEVTEKVSNRLFKKVRSPEDLTRMKEEEIAKLIYPIGFYKTKAKSLKKMSKILIDKYRGKVPDDIEELLKLPGVGRKTANLVIIRAFGKYGICVDTHVHRIVNRWGYIKTKSPEETEKVLRHKLPKKYWKKINTLLVLYGKNICKPIKPACENCGIKKYCAFEKH